MRDFLIRKDVTPVDERAVASEEAEVEAMLRAHTLRGGGKSQAPL